MYPAIQAVGLRKSFGDKEVVCGIDLEVAPGAVLAVLGPNGAGKTTTVRMLATLLTPDGGQARVAGHDVVTEAREVRRRIGLTGQFAAVDARLTGRENLQLCGRLHKLGRSGARARATELLARFDLVEAADRPVGSYSGGMRRRLDLAASLVADPSVIFLDEPTTGLDPASRSVLWDIVGELAAQGVAVLLTTQYLEEADQLADRIVVINHGLVIAEGTAAELKARVRGEQIELALTPESPVPAVVAALAVAGLAATTVEGEERALVVQASCTSDAIERTAAAVRAGGGELSGFAVRHPSLDEVFLSLVGPAAQDPPDQPERDQPERDLELAAVAS